MLNVAFRRQRRRKCSRHDCFVTSAHRFLNCRDKKKACEKNDPREEAANAARVMAALAGGRTAPIMILASCSKNENHGESLLS
jgi:hypothetical protein